MNKILRSFFCFFLLIYLGFTGCTYLNQRGKDALDIFDVGISVTDKWSPDFAVYANPFQIAPLGYSRINGRFLGIANRQAGWLKHEQRCWASILWGSEQKGSGRFNPFDPHQARKDQVELTERPQFNVGILRMLLKDNLPPTLQFFECDKWVHLGWIGIRANCRPLDLIDFILGWTTLDLAGDDLDEDTKQQLKETQLQ
ncbi:MAG: hypothetical protein N2246_00465 [Candidatus Sumerlaeia bacterium]|nr:hypothetical protein [Candidatus Sumerlaeia bacterium]